MTGKQRRQKRFEKQHTPAYLLLKIFEKEMKNSVAFPMLPWFWVSKHKKRKRSRGHGATRNQGMITEPSAGKVVKFSSWKEKADEA